MIKYRSLFILLILSVLAIRSWGQEEEKSLIERTVPIATLYSNFHTQVNGNNLGFDVERAYLGFKTQVNPNYAIIMKIDI